MSNKYRAAFNLLRDAELLLADAQYHLRLDKEECLEHIHQAITEAQKAECLVNQGDE